MRVYISIIILVLLVFTTAYGLAAAQGGFEIVSSTVNAGRISQGGSLSLWGVAGQAEASVLTGGKFTLTSGYGSSTAPSEGVYLPTILK